MTDYLNELNESQREAVLYNEGPSLVIAGAGSGKTRVLTYKIAYLLDNGYEPWSILALTFTNKAAREMKERIARQVGQERARYLWMGTFHSIFSRILRAEAEALGFTPNFTIYDATDSKSLVKTIIKEMNLDDKVYKPGMVQGRISNAKNHLVLPEVTQSQSLLFFQADPGNLNIHIKHRKPRHVLDRVLNLLLHLLADVRNTISIFQIQSHIHAYMLLRNFHLNAFGKVLHSKLSNQLVRNISRHGIHSVNLSCCQAGNNCHDFIRNLDFSNFVLFINLMTASLCFRCHNNYLLYIKDTVIIPFSPLFA